MVAAVSVRSLRERVTACTAILALAVTFVMAAAARADGPKAASNLVLKAPIERWDHAIPLGNGLTGGLLWGDGGNLKLSLDRGDLWDLRLPKTFLRKDWTWKTLQRMVAEGDNDAQVALIETPHREFPYPTKIPAARLELTLDESLSAKTFVLDLRAAVGRVDLGGKTAEVFFSATEPVTMIRIPGNKPKWRIVPPASLAKLEYPPPRTGSEGNVSWSLQEAAAGLKYAVVVGERRAGAETQLALAITSTNDGPDPVALGRKRVEAALEAGYEKMLRPHLAWWKEFWSQSNVDVPDPAVQQHYDLVQYFYGAASRRGAPPIPLQGVWTADAGGLPPWRGDYHHDLNTQLTYWAYLAAGHFDQGAAFTDFMWDLLPVHRKFARDFYGTPGAAVVGIMTLGGTPIGGWRQYSVSPTSGAWVAQSFYLHWRYTMDREFLDRRAYPYCAEIATCLEALLKPGQDGKLKLPLSSSPEIHGNGPKAWLTPNSNYDLSLLQWLYGVLVEMAEAKGDKPAAARWQKVVDGLDELAVDPKTSVLRLSPDETLAESHRHHSHLMAVHPLGLMNIEGSDRDRRVIDASLAQIDKLGTQLWCGYSFSWMSCLSARCGKADRAVENLEIYLKAFILRNGFHCNGDYKRLGYSKFSYQPFTMEGNFAAGQAVHEMLLGSWGGTVRVFPATPDKWADVAFDDLRAEGAFAVSAKRRAGRTVWVRVRSEQGGPLRLRDPFAGKAVKWNRADVKKVGPDYRCTLKRGEVLEGTPK